MITLGIETATMSGGVGIVDEKRLIAELRLSVRATHSERLLPGLDYLLGQAGLTVKDIGLLAISAGPGSFTGLRVGFGLVKGISFATGGTPIIAVPTLEAFAWHFPACRMPVCPLLDARKKELYGAVFLWGEDGFERAVPESVMKPDRWVEMLKDEKYEKIIFTGEGALLYMEELTGALGGRAVFAPPQKMTPSPANVAALGMMMLKKGHPPAEPASLAPFYIRKSEAELKSRRPEGA